MQATQIIAPGIVKFIQIEKPTLEPGHAIIRPQFLSLCGSDIHMVFYSRAADYPSQPGSSGHEMVGIVEAIDPPDGPIKAGDWVLALSPAQVAMTEYLQVPIQLMIALPATLPPQTALQAQQLGTVLYACKQLPTMIGKTAVVIGQGSAGLYFNHLLKRLGASKIISLDLTPNRLALSPYYGASHAVLNTGANAVGTISDITNHAMADLVVEAAGEPSSINLAAHLVKQHGHLLYFGIPRAPVIQFDFQVFFSKYCRAVSISGTASEPGLASTKQALDMITCGEINVEPLITHTFPFTKVMDAYNMAHQRSDNCIKILVQLPGGTH